MKTLIPILLFLLPFTAFGQFCCCIGCGNLCIPQAEANCGLSCFFNGACGVGAPFETSASSTCLGTACNALPIELAAFDLRTKDESVILSWSTETETNNEGFEIQRFSGVEMNWKTIAFIPGAGTTYARKNYDFEDGDVPPGDNYYRLKQIDFDKAFSLSGVKSARIDENTEYSIFPSLARDQVIVRMDSDANHNHNEEHRIHVFDMMGNLIYENTFIDGLILDVSFFPSGSYIANISSYGVLETYRFLKVE